MWTGLKNVSYRSGATLYAASRIRKSYSRSIRMRKDVSTAAPPVAASCALVGRILLAPFRAGRIQQAVRRHGRDCRNHDQPRHTVSQHPGLGGGGGRARHQTVLDRRAVGRAAALVLAAYTLVLGLIFHAYWLGPAAEARFDRIIFYNHLSIIGGMLVVVAFGAGCWRHPGRDTPRSGASLIRNLS